MTLPRPRTAQQLRATRAEVRCEIDRLLDQYTDAQEVVGIISSLDITRLVAEGKLTDSTA